MLNKDRIARFTISADRQVVIIAVHLSYRVSRIFYTDQINRVLIYAFDFYVSTGNVLCCQLIICPLRIDGGCGVISSGSHVEHINLIPRLFVIGVKVFGIAIFLVLIFHIGWVKIDAERRFGDGCLRDYSRYLITLTRSHATILTPTASCSIAKPFRMVRRIKINILQIATGRKGFL